MISSHLNEASSFFCTELGNVVGFVRYLYTRNSTIHSAASSRIAVNSNEPKIIAYTALKRHHLICFRLPRLYCLEDDKYQKSNLGDPHSLSPIVRPSCRQLQCVERRAHAPSPSTAPQLI